MKRGNNQRERLHPLRGVFVIGIMFVLMGIAIVQSFGSREGYQANSAMDTVVSQLRVARELAITQRADVQSSLSPTAPHNKFSTRSWRNRAPKRRMARWCPPVFPHKPVS